MSIEIERKFLLANDSWKLSPGMKSKIYRQGYLSTVTKHTVRVRTAGRKAFITIKGKRVGFSRSEFEYEIPFKDAQEMFELCEKPIIGKVRYIIKLHNVIWEVDEYFGENEGLVVAEVELKTKDQKIDFPSWIGEEVTEDPRYANSSLVRNPYKSWIKK
jgi:adenylate cyclase